VSLYDREQAEQAFEALYDRLYLPGQSKKLKLLWAKSQLDLSQKKKQKKSQKPPD